MNKLPTIFYCDNYCTGMPLIAELSRRGQGLIEILRVIEYQKTHFELSNGNEESSTWGKHLSVRLRQQGAFLPLERQRCCLACIECSGRQPDPDDKPLVSQRKEDNLYPTNGSVGLQLLYGWG